MKEASKWEEEESVSPEQVELASGEAAALRSRGSHSGQEWGRAEAEYTRMGGGGKRRMLPHGEQFLERHWAKY